MKQPTSTAVNERPWFRFGLGPGVTVDVTFSAPFTVDDLASLREMLEAQARVLCRRTAARQPPDQLPVP